MENRYSFAPPRQAGLLLHIGFLLILVAMIGFGIWQIIQSDIGVSFFLGLLLALFAFSFLPLLIYRAYALWGAYYILERDGVRIHWGLRVEEIPINEVLWIITPAQFKQQSGFTPPLPWLPVPGALLGVRKIGTNLPVEYLASSTNRLLYIGTSQRIFAISPNDPQALQVVYQHFLELGSLSPIVTRSIYPTFLFGEIWRSRLVRFLLLSGFLLNILLFGWVSITIPTRQELFLVITAEEPVAPARLMLLPIISGFFFLANSLFGLFFFRRSESLSREVTTTSSRRLEIMLPGKFLAHLLWSASILTSLLLFGAVYLVLLID